DHLRLHTMPVDLPSILSRVPPWRGRTDLVTTPLHGGITNENVRVDVGGPEAGGAPAPRHSFVLRLGGANTHLLGIARQHEWAAARAAAAAGIAPEAVYFVEPEGYILSRFITGQPIPPDEMRRPEMIRLLAGILQRVH